jgi:asparagine synthase (glutamine-hydrolysing)
MLAALREFGPDSKSQLSMANATLGRCLFRTVPEDIFDTQPLRAGSDGWMFVADARIDNRDEIAAALGSSASFKTVSDSEVLFRAYGRWGDKVVEHVVGDFVCAVWHEESKSLTLIRDAAGQRPLYYCVSEGVVAFSSMPSGIHAAGIPRLVDRGNLARFIGDAPLDSGSSYFRDVRRVPPGHVVTISQGRQVARRYWQMPRVQTRFARDQDYEEALREELERAIRPRLRGASARVGAHLSGGLDSAAVTSSAARLLPQADVVAFTGAPRPGFDGPVPRGRIADESVAAASLARRYSNVEHVIVRPDGSSPMDLLRRDTPVLQEPLAFPCNYLWWSAVHKAAAGRGLRVMLTGQAGNLTLSAGGLATLSSLLSRRDWTRWTKEARLLRANGTSIRGILAASFGPWVPRPIWKMAVRIASAEGLGDEALPFLAPGARLLLSDHDHLAGDGPPLKDERIGRWQVLTSYDPANFRKMTLARYGVDERDPTADRRFSEFCFSLPPEQLFRGGVTRRLARRAFARDLPEAYTDGKRGYQAADWYESLTKERMKSELEALATCPEAGALIDLGRVNALVDSWPHTGWETWPVVSTYRMLLLRLMSAAALACPR